MTCGTREGPEEAAGGVSGLAEPTAGEPVGVTFHHRFSAVAASVGAARARVREFSRTIGLHDTMVDDIALAVSEAATNIVVHAYRDTDRPGMIDIAAAVAADELWVIVSDTGRGVHPRSDSPGLGLGLAIIAQVADGLDIVHPTTGGLELRMRFALPGKESG